MEKRDGYQYFGYYPGFIDRMPAMVAFYNANKHNKQYHIAIK